MASRVAAGTIACAVIIAGCVPHSTHTQALAELEAARKTSAQTTRTLEKERTESASRIKSLEDDRTRLVQDLEASRAVEARLSHALSSVNQSLDLALDAHRQREKDADALREDTLRVKTLLEQLVRERDVLRSQYADLERQVQTAQQEQRAAAKALADAGAQIATLRNDRDQTTRKLRDAEHALDDLSQLLAGVEEERKWLEAEKEKIEQARAAEASDTSRAARTREELAESLKKHIEQGLVQIRQTGHGLTVEIADRALFESGQSRVKPAGLKVLQPVGDILKTVKDRHIRVEGHTALVPSGTRSPKAFPAGWELTTARALSVMRYLVDQAGVDRTVIGAGGYVDALPVNGHGPDTAKAFTHRVEIFIGPTNTMDGAVPEGR